MALKLGDGRWYSLKVHSCIIPLGSEGSQQSDKNKIGLLGLRSGRWGVMAFKQGEHLWCEHCTADRRRRTCLSGPFNSTSTSKGDESCSNRPQNTLL